MVGRAQKDDEELLLEGHCRPSSRNEKSVLLKWWRDEIQLSCWSCRSYPLPWTRFGLWRRREGEDAPSVGAAGEGKFSLGRASDGLLVSSRLLRYEMGCL